MGIDGKKEARGGHVDNGAILAGHFDEAGCRPERTLGAVRPRRMRLEGLFARCPPVRIRCGPDREDEKGCVEPKNNMDQRMFAPASHQKNPSL